MPTNPGCAACDFKEACQRKLRFGEETFLAKEQDAVRMRCTNTVQDICRDCRWFHEKRCASWKVLNGKIKNKGTLSKCPSKVSL